MRRPWELMESKNIASMGPRLFRRGNCWPGRQWFQEPRASMGPRLFRRGNSGCVFFVPRKGKSFNGATSFQTWKSTIENSASYIDSWLQWGHVFSDVEMRGALPDTSLPGRLQWGHVFSDVEMAAKIIAEFARIEASMGPRLFRRGK